MRAPVRGQVVDEGRGRVVEQVGVVDHEHPHPMQRLYGPAERVGGRSRQQMGERAETE
ncbi:hypothetical protein [Microbispora triticiradicis]|uniref:hypothetical protein n=1 Tax=Microbispora triticiradicis TaxID=2200763 RepID=UPI001AD7FD5A|nr:hypothetical protein [Microbispora triticiradicis]